VITEAVAVRVEGVAEKLEKAHRMDILCVLAAVDEETGFWPLGISGAGRRAALRRTYAGVRVMGVGCSLIAAGLTRSER
jgi:hypothetical protein